MKQRNLFRILTSVFLVISVAFAGNAQFGKFLKKAKKAVQKVERTEERAQGATSTNETVLQTAPKEEARPAATEEPDMIPIDPNAYMGEKVPNYRKIYEPSAEAKAADPNATNETVDKGFTKSIGQIHSFYEHLDEARFPYQPYYAWPNFYRMDTPENNKHLMDRCLNLAAEVFKMRTLQSLIVPIEEITAPDGTKYAMTWDEKFRNAWTALYYADPTSLAAFKSFAWVIMFHSPMVHAKLHYQFDDEQKGIVNAEKGYMVPFADYRNRTWKRESDGITLALTVTDFKEVADYSLSWLEAAESEGDPFWKLLNYTMGRTLYENIIVDHDRYDANNPSVRKMDMILARMNPHYSEYEDTYRAVALPPEPLPKGVSVSADIRNAATAAAKDYAGDKFSKIIFLSSSWQTFKEQKWPYRIMAYKLPVVVVTQEGKYMMQEKCDLQKSPSGEKYYISAGMDGGGKIRVKE